VAIVKATFDILLHMIYLIRPEEAHNRFFKSEICSTLDVVRGNCMPAPAKNPLKKYVK
jgi:hypothetical protein